MGVAIDWLSVIALLVANYTGTWIAFWPMRRYDWREWKINGTPVDWKKERLLMWPPLFLNPYIWVFVQMLGGLGAALVVASDNSVPQYQVALLFYAASYIVFQISIYPVLWTQVTWIVLVWAISNGLAWVAAIVSYTVHVPGGVVLTIYAGLVSVIWLVNAIMLLVRMMSKNKDKMLHRRWTPFPVFDFVRNGFYYPNTYGHDPQHDKVMTGISSHMRQQSVSSQPNVIRIVPLTDE